MKTTTKTLTLIGLAALGAAGTVYSGWINVAADAPHSAPVETLLQLTRERSIAIRARDIAIPDLTDEALIRAGAGNYHAMCIGCHLSPGMQATELSQNLYPAPPQLAQKGRSDDPAAAFWVIKHGIKASGMPAWGKSMGDEHIWGMVAFLQQLPELDAPQYQALVAASAGHQHGGGETNMHDHSSQHPSQRAAGESAEQSGSHAHGMAEREVHHHADGSKHMH